ncbi:transfer complex protein TraA [Staphylococcus capitis]|uniref:TrsA protein n=4 Tax=Staphylococcus TaxID=1279 RepID=A0A141BHY5_STAXY|nr:MULTISPECIES: conjugative transfer protein TrsA [Staphylococcaceae]AJM87270.1 conjugal transfer protein traA [Staphylococcus aureus]AKL80229.1 TrsA protein [Staphylococcus xylosus]EXO68595.1 transfer complex protein TraA [Staphylococcus aureus W12586]EXP55055.1 transfer complex protein TraA [Staphylococcus aureus W12583]MBX8806073.1 transfer complex protein TraA [Staphylococcus aureus]
MDNVTFRKRIEEYRKRSIEQKKYESKLNYQSRFGVKDDEVNTFNIKGIATDRKENKLVMAEDREDKQKVLLYANKDNDMYYLNSGSTYKEAVQNTFGNETNYEMVDDELFIYNSKNQALTNYDQLNEYHNRQKQLQYNTQLEQERKQRLTDTNKVSENAKEDLALSLGLTATALKGNINISSVEKVTDNESMVTLENEINGKSEHLISDFKDSFIEKAKEKLTVSPSMRLGFEELKNASGQIAMGFTEFFGARYDESTLENDPKVVATEKGYSVSVFDKDGNKKDLTSADTFEEAVKLSKEMKQDNSLSRSEIELNQELEKKKI